MPVPTKIKRNVGIKGLADVRTLKNSLRVQFEDGSLYEVTKEGWERPDGRYIVTLDPTNDKIMFVSPPQGTYLVTFREFGGRQGGSEDEPGLPEPYIKRGGTYKRRDGKGTFTTQDELTFSCKLSVIEKGAYNDLNILYTLPYGFEPVPGTAFAQIVARQKSLERIDAFLRTVGFNLAENDIPFSSNVLPWLEERIQAAKKVFSVTLNAEGYVDTITEIPSYLIPPDLVGGKKSSKPKSPSKSTKKGAAKK